MRGLGQERDRISVIIPVYKVENYIERCVRSVMSQSYENLEIILVDDGSPDNCPELCEAYRNEDERVCVIHKRNGGLSSARNAGLEVASGEYVLFVDSDDWIAPDMAELLYGTCAGFQADIAECGVINVYNDGATYQTGCTGDIVEVEPLQALEGMLDYRYFLPMAWNKLYRRSIMGEIRYPEGKLHEDEFTTHKYYLASRKIIYVDTAKYYYNQTRDDSITGSAFSTRSLDACEAFHERMHLFWELGFHGLEKKMNDNFSHVLFSRLYKCFEAGLNDSRVKEVIDFGLGDWRQIKAESRPLADFYELVYLSLEKGMKSFADCWQETGII